MSEELDWTSLSSPPVPFYLLLSEQSALSPGSKQGPEILQNITRNISGSNCPQVVQEVVHSRQQPSGALRLDLTLTKNHNPIRSCHLVAARLYLQENCRSYWCRWKKKPAQEKWRQTPSAASDLDPASRTGCGWSQSGLTEETKWNFASIRKVCRVLFSVLVTLCFSCRVDSIFQLFLNLVDHLSELPKAFHGLNFTNDGGGTEKKRVSFSNSKDSGQLLSCWCQLGHLLGLMV